MRRLPQLFLAAALAAVPPGADAQTRPAGDRDDQLVVTGCVTPVADARAAGPQSIFLWSRGDVYLTYPDIRMRPAERTRPVGTTGAPAPVVYWIDDENDFARHVGQRVEIVGELSAALRTGELDIEADGDMTEIEFDAGGREATARIPTSWLGPQTRGKDTNWSVIVRTVDVEKVTVLGPCAGR